MQNTVDLRTDKRSILFFSINNCQLQISTNETQGFNVIKENKKKCDTSYHHSLSLETWWIKTLFSF